MWSDSRGKSSLQLSFHSQIHICGKYMVYLYRRENRLPSPLTDMNLLPITISSSSCLRERKYINMKSLESSSINKQSQQLIGEPTSRCRNCTGAPAHRPTTKFHLNKKVVKHKVIQRNCFQYVVQCPNCLWLCHWKDNMVQEQYVQTLTTVEAAGFPRKRTPMDTEKLG